MKIIGEKINGTRSRVAQAILDRDSTFIADLATSQVAGGADYVDVNAGTTPDRETEDLLWLVGIVQGAVDKPLCIDSSHHESLAAALKVVGQTPMINSISGETGRLKNVLPLVAEYGCPVITLALDDNGIPKSVEDRLTVVRRIVRETRAKGVPDGNLYIDPLILTLGTEWKAGQMAIETMQKIRSEFPDAHLTCGLSNISFGLPSRALINRTFMTLATMAGLDSAIMDPTNKDMREAVLATELVLGRDRFCRKYTAAFRPPA